MVESCIFMHLNTICSIFDLREALTRRLKENKTLAQSWFSPFWVATQSSATGGSVQWVKVQPRGHSVLVRLVNHTQDFLMAKTTHFIFPGYTLRSSDFPPTTPTPSSSQCLVSFCYPQICSILLRSMIPSVSDNT